MFKLKNLFTILFILSISTITSKANNTIAYVNLDLIFSESKPGKFLLNELKKLELSNLEKFKKEEELLKVEENKILSKKNIISKEEYNRNINMFKKKVKIYQKNKIKFIEDFKIKKNEEILKFLNLINPLIEDIMTQQGIEIILEKKNIFIAKSNNDITNIIIETINKSVTNFEIKQ